MTEIHTDAALAARAQDWLDHLDPEITQADDPKELRRIGLAKRDIAHAESELHSAVQQARRAGFTWAEIGLTLGVTRQAAQERFGEPART